MGEPPERLNGGSVSPIAAADVEKVIAQQSQYWTCLKSSAVEVAAQNVDGGERMHGGF
jgi:hypothetical protein